MPNQPTQPTLSEKCLLTPDNCVVATIELQPQMLFGVNHCGAYGAGVEYAYTKAHKAPATMFPEYRGPAPTTH